MAIVFDSEGHGANNQANGKNVSFTHAMGSGSNGIVFVFFASSDDNSITLTYGGNTMTAVTWTQDHIGGGNNYQAWYYINPPAGSNTIAGTLALTPGVNGIEGFQALSYFGVSQSSPVVGADRKYLPTASPFSDQALPGSLTDAITGFALSDFNGLSADQTGRSSFTKTDGGANVNSLVGEDKLSPTTNDSLSWTPGNNANNYFAYIRFAAAPTTSILSIAGIPQASINTVSGLTNVNIKSVSGINNS